MPLPNTLTETSNNSVRASQRDSPAVKAANKERQTIISTVSLVSCCCTEIVACMCKQSTPEKLHNKQFKAVVWMLRHDARRPTAKWTAICWVVMVSDCQVLSFAYVCVRESERERMSEWKAPHVRTKHDLCLPLPKPPHTPSFFMDPLRLWKHSCKLEKLFSSTAPLQMLMF